MSIIEARDLLGVADVSKTAARRLIRTAAPLFLAIERCYRSSQYRSTLISLRDLRDLRGWLFGISPDP